MPSFTTQPVNLTVADGQAATFTVAASGTDPLSYQWQRNGSDIAGATSASYSVAASALSDSGAMYQVVVRNSAGSATSTAAALTVTPVAPTVATAPADVTVSAGQTASLSVTAKGSAPLSYQWLRNGAAVSDATEASYTTPALADADNGASYSVTVTNMAGSVTSAAATVTVTSAPMAAGIATAPKSLSVTVGQTATFSVTASGSAPIAYQWLLNGTAISGATSSSYTTGATTTADTGGRYSVKVSNAIGSATSAEALLTVNPAVSVLSGRAWTAGRALETDDNAVVDHVSGIDDAGNAMVVFVKYNGTRYVLYATRGVAGAAGAASVWTTPVPIDLLAGQPVSSVGSAAINNRYSLVVAPNGNAVAYWNYTAACSASTYSVSGSCNYIYTARYLAATATWEAPMLVGDQPANPTSLSINNNGDVALFGTGWQRSGTNSYTRYPMAAWRANGASGYRQGLFTALDLGASGFDMDDAGNMLLVAEAKQNSTTDIVAYRGTLAEGFGDQQVLDTRGAAASLRTVAVGRKGPQLVLWVQNNGTAATVYAATSISATAVFSAVDLGLSKLDTSSWVTVSDGGQAYLFDVVNHVRLPWSDGAWGTAQSLPAVVTYPVGFTASRNGNFVGVLLNGLGQDTPGLYESYDAVSNSLIQTPTTVSPGSGYVLGLSSSAGYGQPQLSLSGIAFIPMINKFDTLPSAAVPNGDGRDVVNLWGAFLK